MTRIVLGARGAPEWARRLVAMPEFQATTIHTTEESLVAALKQQVGSSNRAVLVSGSELDHGDVLRLVALSTDLGVPSIAVLSPDDAELIHEVMLRGAAGYRIQPGPIEPLVADIHKVAAQVRARVGTAHPTTANGRVLVVASATGGSGKTAIATRLAAFMATSLPKDQVAFLDLNVCFGGADVAFDIEPERTVSSIVPAAGELDRNDLLGATAMTFDGVRLLGAPTALDEAAALQSGEVSALLDDMRRAFRLTVIDTASYVDDIFVSALRGADLSLMVVTPDLLSVRSALKLVDAARRLGVSRERLGTVVNGVGVGKQTTLSVSEIRSLFHGSVFTNLPLMSGLRGDCAPVQPSSSLAGGQWARNLAPLASQVVHTLGLDLAVQPTTPAQHLNRAGPTRSRPEWLSLTLDAVRRK